MTTIQANKNRNYIHLYLNGCAGKSKIEKLLNKTISELEKLTPGFILLIESSNFSIQTKSDEILFSLLLQSIKEHGVVKTILIGGTEKEFRTINSENNFWHSNCIRYEKAASISEALVLIDDYQPA